MGDLASDDRDILSGNVIIGDLHVQPDLRSAPSARRLLRLASFDELERAIDGGSIGDKARDQELDRCPQTSDRLVRGFGINVGESDTGDDDAEEAENEQGPDAESFRKGPVLDDNERE